jgi:hypothetical protein
MTREQWAKLTDEEKRIKVAELCGWKRGAKRDRGGHYWAMPGWYPQCTWVEDSMPDYLNDLNAMHEAEKTIHDDYRDMYADYLVEISGFHPLGVWSTTARQRAEAFVLTMEN